MATTSIQCYFNQFSQVVSWAMGKINKENEQLNISKIGYYLVDDCNVPNMMVYKSMFAVKTHSCRGKI